MAHKSKTPSKRTTPASLHSSTQHSHTPGNPTESPVHSTPSHQGQVRLRPVKGRSQLTPKVHPLAAFTHRTQRFQPLPAPLGEPPYHYELETAAPGVGAHAAAAGKLVFHCVGDTGGVKSPDYQNAVATALKTDLNLPDPDRPQFFYHLGDVIYFNGQITDYYSQFYEPYDHYYPPIIAIPGNHDGDPINASQTSLDGFTRYFTNEKMVVQPESKDAPRVTLSLPNVYHTLVCPLVTIVGMYSNVPEGGSIDSIQQQWLTNELATAPMDKALIVAVHHPIFSFDDYHSGSAAMATALQTAINDSRRVPNLVLSAHVHNYQLIEKTIVQTGPTPFVVAGMGGYYHLHGIQVTAPTTDSATDATLLYEQHKHHGYMTLTVDKDNISALVQFVPVAGKEDAGAPAESHTWSYPAAPMTLPAGAMITL